MTLPPEGDGRALSDFGESALRYARAGFPVFPLAPRTKVPLIAGGRGYHDATTDEAQIVTWWSEQPDANVGIAVPPGMAVVDVDPRHDGNLTVARLVTKHGELASRMAKTGRGDGGHHLYFSVNGKEVPTSLGDGIEVKRAGAGYVVAPPSIHPDTGQPYVWVDWNQAIAPLPDWVYDLFPTAPGTGREPDPIYDDPRLRNPSDPGHDFNARGDLTPYLIEAGWQKKRNGFGGQTYWVRPGESLRHTHAAIWYPEPEKRVFMLWSNAPETKLPRPTDEGKEQIGLSPWRVFGYLRHQADDGTVDWHGAAAELRSLGFGRQSDAEESEPGPDTSIPPRNACNRATAQPELASDLHILDRFGVAIGGCGLVGERATAQLLYLAITSRLFDKPVSVGVKGHSSSGKSFVVQVVCRFFPASAVIEKTAMSQRALVYMQEDFRHRVLILYEVVALREGVQDDMTSYLVRSLLSEGCIDYSVTVRDPKGGYTTKHIRKEGPTGLIFTTTKPRVHGENETRVLSLTSDDSRAQTGRVLAALASDATGDTDLTQWVELQRWLEDQEECRVVIPYARKLARLVPPVAVRLRRDFAHVLSLIRAHALLHRVNREKDHDGRIVASLDDYEVVAKLISPLIAEGVGATVSEATRETVNAVIALTPQHPYGVTAQAVGAYLDLDKSTVSRRLSVAATGGWITNQEDRKGKPGRWVVGEALPGAGTVLPTVAELQAVVSAPATGDEDESAG